ncbi:hypothetical protein FOZ63_007038 [Perkinsus olseni]|uniref:Peptidase A1 domain-containing protein n=1 Tax=Perkinsus olseni TaxID=32597 RepID=A0A7J6T286_PEROL|nr:hypothetical protein FOZ62_025966 [Perkinsus olseni]KAF4738520.1 hypothetical protein FOZ63_007038 [Perkinsus olseni]
MASKGRGSFHFVADEEYDEALPTVQISSLRLSDVDGFLREYPVSLTSPLDTGSTALYLPNDIVEALSRNLRRRGYFDYAISECFEITDRGMLGVSGTVVDYLPVLSFDLGNQKRSMRVQLHPREYCHCSPAYCRVAMRASNSTSLGTPFCRAFNVHVDHDDHKRILTSKAREKTEHLY